MDSFYDVEVKKFSEIDFCGKNYTFVYTVNPQYYFEISDEIKRYAPELSENVIFLYKDTALYREMEKYINRDFDVTVDEVARNIKLIVESQWRTGTNFLTRTIAEKAGCELAFVDKKKNCRLRHKYFSRLFYPGKKEAPLIVFSHFDNPVDSHVALSAPVLYLLGYLFDAYHSKGYFIYRKRYAPGAKEEDKRMYKLKFDSPEFCELRNSLNQNLFFLEVASERDFILYEDWVNNKDRNTEKVRKFFPEAEPGWFSVQKRPRLYFDGNYSDAMDKKVFEYIKGNFSKYIKLYWPEKSGDTYR